MSCKPIVWNVTWKMILIQNVTVIFSQNAAVLTSSSMLTKISINKTRGLTPQLKGKQKVIEWSVPCVYEFNSTLQMYIYVYVTIVQSFGNTVSVCHHRQANKAIWIDLKRVLDHRKATNSVFTAAIFFIYIIFSQVLLIVFFRKTTVQVWRLNCKFSLVFIWGETSHFRSVREWSPWW